MDRNNCGEIGRNIDRDPGIRALMVFELLDNPEREIEWKLRINRYHLPALNKNIFL